MSGKSNTNKDQENVQVLIKYNRVVQIEKQLEVTHDDFKRLSNLNSYMTLNRRRILQAEYQDFIWLTEVLTDIQDDVCDSENAIDNIEVEQIESQS